MNGIQTILAKMMGTSSHFPSSCLLGEFQDPLEMFHAPGKTLQECKHKKHWNDENAPF